MLHDIGHTPFGHAGERTLGLICRGEKRICGLPDFPDLNVNFEFKHNVNSGFLYLCEVTGKKANEVIFDGITRHTKLPIDINKCGIKDMATKYQFQDTLNDIKSNNNKRYYPIYVEGLIVKFADEIAQAFSDYVDLAYVSKSGFDKFLADNKISAIGTAHDVGKRISEKMMNVFAKEFCNGYKKYYSNKQIYLPDLCEYLSNENSKVASLINGFDDARKKIIGQSQRVQKFDQLGELIVSSLFVYYFNNSMNNKDIARTFYNLVIKQNPSRYKWSKTYSLLSKSSDQCLSFFLHNIKKQVETKNNKLCKNAGIDRKLYKLYINAIAIYISKMTDKYATEKFKII